MAGARTPRLWLLGLGSRPISNTRPTAQPMAKERQLAQLKAKLGESEFSHLEGSHAESFTSYFPVVPHQSPIL